MYAKLRHGLGAAAIGMAMLGLAGCETTTLQVQVINAGNQPITAVRMVPFHEDADDQAQAFEEAQNLLPRDAEDVTIALAAGSTVTLPDEVSGAFYLPSVTFFAYGEYVEYVDTTPVDLTGLPEDALVSMEVKRFRPEDKADPEVEITFYYY